MDFAARIAERWQREPTIGIQGAVAAYTCGEGHLFPGHADHSMRTRRYALMNEYDGCEIEEIFSGTECHTTQGDCYAVRSSVPCTISRPDAGMLSTALMHDLRLIHGIGPKRAGHLRSQGYTTIGSLTRHHRFGEQAESLAALFGAEDWDGLGRLVAARFPASHPCNLLFSLLFRTDEMLFFDIETMGLFSRPIILLATGRVRRGTMHISQYLLRDIGEEPAAIAMVLDEIAGENTALVTYNGKAFDVPYLRDRAAYYGMEPPCAPGHFDLLHPSRRRWKSRFADCRLATIEEQVLGIFREDDLPGKYVPEYYASYLRSENPGPLVPIVDHNRQDIVSLAHLYERLLEGYREGYPSEA